MSKLLKKHAGLWEGESVALDPDPADASLFGSLRFTDASRLTRAGRGDLETLATPEREFDVAVLYLPKGKRRQALMTARAAQLAPKVVVIGSKTQGIKSARKRLAELGPVIAVEHGAHQQMIVVKPELRTPVDLDAWEVRHTIDEMTLVSLPGVFSEGRVDDGTRLLLEHVKVEGRVLDLGCGCGVIGAALAKRGCTVTCSDVDALAVEAARRTFAANELSRESRFVHADRYSGLEGDARFDAIVSNPPFHEGVATQYDTTPDLIRGARRFLRAGGALWLVYNRFLPWADVLAEDFAEVEIVADDGRYCVARAR